MSERDVLAGVLIAVTALPGVMAWRSNTGAAVNAWGRKVQFGLPGTPDILGCVRGTFVGIEVKSATGRQTLEQVRFQAQFEASGGLYILARSVDDAINGLASVLSA